MMSKDQTKIELKNVSVYLQDKAVLKDINICLTQKKIAVIGANGSGKSTFSRLLNGLFIPDSGTVLVNGLDTRKHGKAIRRLVGFVFQNPDNQIVMPVVEEDLAFGMKNIGYDKSEIFQYIDEVLTRYQLEESRSQSAHLLSGGQKQLIAICGVLLMKPSIIVFDEPTTQLDLRNKRKISETIFSLEQQVIVVSHDLDFLSDFDRVLVFDHGRIVYDGKVPDAIRYYKELMM